MCGRFGLATTIDELIATFGFEERPNLPARYNIAPTHAVALLTDDAGARRLRMMRWGLIPHWARDPFGADGIAKRALINARVETAAEKPAFRDAFARGRALILADGFYEWKAELGGKRPWRVHLDGRPFAFAALTARWEGGEEAIDSATIVTGPAPEALAWLHHRAPVAFDPARDAAAMTAWLNKDRSLEIAAHPAPDWRWAPASRALNAAGAEGVELLDPDYGEQPALF